jgi:hypothetical protein
MRTAASPLILINDTELEDLGYWPDMFSEEDPRSAVEQINERYAHGGGWHPLEGCTIEGNLLKYPGDPPFRPRAMYRLHGKELLVLFEHDFVAIIQDDKSYEVGRMN